jgi:hypothetical protein
VRKCNLTIGSTVRTVFFRLSFLSSHCNACSEAQFLDVGRTVNHHSSLAWPVWRACFYAAQSALLFTYWQDLNWMDDSLLYISSFSSLPPTPLARPENSRIAISNCLETESDKGVWFRFNYFSCIEPIGIQGLGRDTGLVLKLQAVLFLLSLIVAPFCMENLYPAGNSVTDVLRGTIEGTFIYLNRNIENVGLISRAFVMLVLRT